MKANKVASVALLLFWSCGSEQPGIADPNVTPNDEQIPQLLVSNPINVGGSGPATLSGDGYMSQRISVVYVSASPGSFSVGTAAEVAASQGGFVGVDIVAGGFDPVSLTAQVGDTVFITVFDGSVAVLNMTIAVPDAEPPIIVRTDPPRKKLSVPLGVSPFIVFSEPIDPRTATPQSITLSVAGNPVDGTVDVSTDGLRVFFRPAATWLMPETEYALVISEDVADLDGSHLEATESFTFTTKEADTVASVRIAFDTLRVLPSTATTITVSVLTEDGFRPAGITPIWQSLNPTVATVVLADTLGFTATLNAISIGVAEIVVQAGDLADTLHLIVREMTASSISSGGKHTCAVDAEGAAFCWGRDSTGQLGNDTLFVGSTSPTQVAAPTLRFTTISSGTDHTCAIAQEEGAFCWGHGIVSVGVRGLSVADRPVPVVLFDGTTFAAIAAGSGTTCALMISSATCFGLFRGANVAWTTYAYPLDTETDITFSVITTGQGFGCGLDDRSKAFCWGENWTGQLGNGTSSATFSLTWEFRLEPFSVNVIDDLGQISSGRFHTCAITTTGELYCWGANNRSQSGASSDSDPCFTYYDEPVIDSGGLFFPCSRTPRMVGSESLTFAAVSAGDLHTCALTEIGQAYCWGDNTYGQLGVSPSTNPKQRPVAVQFAEPFKEISAGGSHTCGLTVANIVYCWGANEDGQLGDGTNLDSYVPVKVLEQP